MTPRGPVQHPLERIERPAQNPAPENDGGNDGDSDGDLPVLA